MTLTRTQLDRMEQLAPGVYVDPRDESMHIIAADMLAAHGFEPTPENIDRLDEQLKVIAASYGIERVEADVIEDR